MGGGQGLLRRRRLLVRKQSRSLDEMKQGIYPNFNAKVIIFVFGR